MAATPEAAVKREIRALLSLVYQRAPTTGGYGRSGQLDFTCCIHGQFVAIEAKSIHSDYGHKGPTALQWEEIDEILSNGGMALSIDETKYADLGAFIRALFAGDIEVARRISQKTLDRHERPNLTPATDTKPTIRKKAK